MSDPRSGSMTISDEEESSTSAQASGMVSRANGDRLKPCLGPWVPRVTRGGGAGGFGSEEVGEGDGAGLDGGEARGIAGTGCGRVGADVGTGGFGR